MKTVFSVLFLVSSVSFAKEAVYTKGQQPGPRTPATLSDGTWSGANSLTLKLTPYVDNLGFGLTYERSYGENFGFGAAIHALPEKKASASSTNNNFAPKLVSITGNVFLHHPISFVDLYFSPGVGLMMVELGSEDDTSVGASLSIGAMAQITPAFALGLDFTGHYPWFNDDFYAAARMFYMTSSISARLTF